MNYKAPVNQGTRLRQTLRRGGDIADIVEICKAYGAFLWDQIDLGWTVTNTGVGYDKAERITYHDTNIIESQSNSKKSDIKEKGV